MTSWSFLRKSRCFICKRVLGENAGTIQYRVADEPEIQEQRICKVCGDALEAGAIKPGDLDE